MRVVREEELEQPHTVSVAVIDFLEKRKFDDELDGLLFALHID